MPPLPTLYLASQSPRRQELLRQIDVSFEVLLPDDAQAAEALETRHGQESPRRYVERVTRLKAQAAQARLAALDKIDRPILCADTTVARGNVIYGKPSHADDARRILRTLAGGWHRVLTAIVVATPHQTIAAVSISHVEIVAMSDDEIEAYIDSGEPFGKAGAYAIQGRMAAYVRTVRGSYSGIMGLPLHETACLLKAALC